MKTQTTHPLHWIVTALVLVCAAGLSVRAGASLTAELAPKGTDTHIKMITPTVRIAEQEDNHIRTCKEAGLCEEGKKRLILNSKQPTILIPVFLQGCHAKKWLKTSVTLECPDAARVPGARTERVFKTQDVFVNAQIGATTVQNRGDRGSGVKVAILDTGIDANHPELSARIAAQASFVAEGTTNDAIGHGTHVAGIIAGQGIQQITDPKGTNRALGSGQGVSLLIGKVCNDQGNCLEGDIAAGIEWAVDQGAQVINMSLGGGAFPGHCDTDPLATRANWAVDQGVTVVAASGNGAEANPGVATPACGSKVIAVGALDWNNVRPVWSGNGTALDVMSVGVDVLSALPCAVAGSCPEAGYGWWSGTSMAAPSVSGVAALLRGIVPTLTPQDVRTALTQTAWDLGNPGYDSNYGAGRVNADAASLQILDRDYDGSLVPADCNDNDPAIRPGAAERCTNTVDDNCNGIVNENCASSSSSSSIVSSISSLSSISSISSAGPVCGNSRWEIGEECEWGMLCPTGMCTPYCRCPLFSSSSSASSVSSASSASSVSSASSAASSWPQVCDQVKPGYQALFNRYGALLPSKRCLEGEILSVYEQMQQIINGLPQCPFPFPLPLPNCSSSSSAQTCEGPQRDFSNLMVKYQEMHWRWAVRRECNLDDLNELKNKMRGLAAAHERCHIALPDPFLRCEVTSDCEGIRPIFLNLVASLQDLRCSNEQDDQTAVEHVRVLLADLLQKYMQCGFSIPSFPPCPDDTHGQGGRNDTRSKKD